MTGSGVRAGLLVLTMRQIDIAPTVALWAGWTLPETAGVALRGLFEHE